jgi:hypothetical protein
MRFESMRSLSGLLRSTELALTILLTSTHISTVSAASASTLTFPPAPSSNLDISQLGQVAILGDFTAASLFTHETQTELEPSINGSLSLLSRYPSGSFAPLAGSDGYIQTMCSLSQNGTFVGVLLGGNFTSLGGVNSPGIALYRTDTQTVQAISGLNGKVNALYCDPTGTAYVGGQFNAGNATNAAAWTNSTGLKGLPFAGFNGPVNAIVKESNGKILFAGGFDGLGNSTLPELENSQEIPLPIATISASSSSTLAGLGDPKNILCKAEDQDGPGNAYLVADGAKSQYWQAIMPFGFNPTLLRLRNTAYQGRGTKTFNVLAIPINGLMNMSYVDDSGNTEYCYGPQKPCPLPQGNATYQDFQFVNSVGMDALQIIMTDCYGDGCGLAGIELYENDIYTFAVNEFNEPQCPGVTFPSKASATGDWGVVTGNAMSSPSFQQARLKGAPVDGNTTVMTFNPDIKQAGNYSITMYTPGCTADASCGTRGRVTISGGLVAGATNGTTFSTEIFQTNDFDKYDEVFLGHIDASTAGFLPTITLQASPGQNGPLTVVAQRVRFELITTSGGLNGIFEYDPNQATVDLNFKKSSADAVGNALDGSAKINAMVTGSDGNVYAGGTFTGGNVQNFLEIGNGTNATAYGGLNGAVQTLYSNGSFIYAGGLFTGTTQPGGPSGLSGVAQYDTTKNSWSPLGGGLAGTVNYIVGFTLSIAGSNTPALAISGTFNKLLAFNGGQPVTVKNFAVWVPSKNDWLDNIDQSIPTLSLQGLLTSGADLPDGNPSVYAGSISSFDVTANGAVEITGKGNTGLQPFPIKNLKTAAADAVQKRAVAPGAGVTTGTFYDSGSSNYTVLAGHFSALDSGSNDISNLAIIDGSQKVSGIQPSGTTNAWKVSSVAVANNLLFVGGVLSGSYNGLAAYDISNNKFAATQPAGLTAGDGATLTVNALSAQPSKGSSLVFVGGSFASAGQLPCEALCVYDASRSQWSAAVAAGATGFSGTVSQLSWVDSNNLLVGGDLSVNGTKAVAALYNVPGHFFTWSAPPTDAITADSLGGLSPGSSTGSVAFAASNTGGVIEKYDSAAKAWTPIPNDLLSNTTVINGLQILTLTKNHASNSFLAQSNSLMLLGHIVLANGTSATAALFNGQSVSPYLITANEASTGAGTANAFIAQNTGSFFMAGKHHLKIGFIVLIGLALALGVVFLLIALGLLLRLLRRRQMGYRAAPSGSEKHPEIVPSALGTGAGALVGNGSDGSGTALRGRDSPSDGNIARENLRRIHPGELFGSLPGRG